METTILLTSKKYSEDEIYNALKAAGWAQTDADSYQYGRKLKDRIFEFREESMNPHRDDFGEVHEFTVNLDCYTQDEINSNISAYYDSIEDLIETYGGESDFIIAECIFEQENGLY